MRLTKFQKRDILPYLQAGVQATLEAWKAQRAIENIIGKESELMGQGMEDLAVGVDAGTDVNLKDVQFYVDSLVVDD